MHAAPDKRSLAPGQLIVAPASCVWKCLKENDISLIVSVGYPCPERTHVPVIRVAHKNILQINKTEKEQSFPAVHQAWSAAEKVLIHCEHGEDRSRTFAWLCLAEYYGPGREEEAKRYIDEHSLRGSKPPYEPMLESAIPLLASDDVALYFAAEVLGRPLLGGDRSAFYVLAQRRMLQRGESLQDLHDAQNKGNLLFDIAGMADDEISPRARALRAEEREFRQAWLYSQETLASLGSDKPSRQSRPSLPRREICAAVLKS